MADLMIPLAIAGGNLAGSLIRAASRGGGPNVNAGLVKEFRTNPFTGPAFMAASEGADRIAGVQHDPLDAALARAAYMREQQNRYLNNLRSVAMGGRSLAQEQMAAEQQRLRHAIMGQRAGARGDYARLGGMRAAPTQASLLGGRMVAPTQQAMILERDQAMEQYRQALAAQGRQDLSAEFMNYLQQQRNRREGLLSGEERRQYGAGQEITSSKQLQDDEVSKQAYG